MQVTLVCVCVRVCGGLERHEEQEEDEESEEGLLILLVKTVI